jgi:hypothetical protein
MTTKILDQFPREPNRKEILQKAKSMGLVVKPGGTLNGATAYRIEGRQGLFSKLELAEMVGF